MAGRTAYQAVHDFRQAVTQAVSCVTRSALTLSPGGYDAPQPHRDPAAQPVRLLMLNDDDPVRLQHPTREVALRASWQFRLAVDPDESRGWKVTTVGYLCSLEDHAEREYLAFHWHPKGRSWVTWPHLHVGPAAGLAPDGLVTPDTHVPSGRIAFAEVIRLAIQQLGVTPRRGVRDWERRLDAAQQTFEVVQSWAQVS